MTSMKIEPVDVGGVSVDVWVSPHGVFSASHGGKDYESATLAGLRDALLRSARVKRAKVSVPFCYLRSMTVVRGTATGLHAKTEKPLVTWANGEKEQFDGVWGHAFRPLADAEIVELEALYKARCDAAAAYEAFVRARRISIGDEVRKAVRADVAAQAARDEAKAKGAE